MVTVALWPALARADLVRPPPADCPPNTTPRSGHGGPHCEPPPPTNCPTHHKPRVYHANAYCEPPPDKPCPTGSFYTSRSTTDTYCQAGRKCDQSPCSNPGHTCRDTSLCMKPRYGPGRRSFQIVSKTCSTTADCGEKEKCVTGKLCDRDVKRGPTSGLPEATPTAAPATEGPSIPTPPRPTESPPPAPPPSPKGAPSTANGCAGCALGSGGPTAALAGWLLLAMTALGCRRRQRLHP